jgi:hypothetical protein
MWRFRNLHSVHAARGDRLDRVRRLHVIASSAASGGVDPRARPDRDRVPRTDAMRIATTMDHVTPLLDLVPVKR